VLLLSDPKRTGRILCQNGSASLIDLREEVACLELHPPMGAFDLEAIDLLSEALDQLEDHFEALVICARTPDFSIGTNLITVASSAQEGNWQEVEAFICKTQQVLQRVRYAPKPVVVAAAGQALGLGAELILNAGRVVAGCELYTGLIDLAAGLIPAAGGTKEMLRRIVNPAMKLPSPDPLVYLQAAFETIAFAKVSSSADEAVQIGFLQPADQVVLKTERLLSTARQQALRLAQGGYRPPLPEKIYAAGRDALAGLRVAIFTIREGGMITEYESCLAEKLAVLLTGGEISRSTWADEQYFLDLEREIFLSICGQPQTQARMWNLIQTGKPLRN
jgi:3-hydroxyacyl-CoA dehydrogenase